MRRKKIDSEAGSLRLEDGEFKEHADQSDGDPGREGGKS